MDNIKKLHPLLTIAAISVTLFSAVGVAAITGVIPHSKGSDEPAVVAATPAPARFDSRLRWQFSAMSYFLNRLPTPLIFSFDFLRPL